MPTLISYISLCILRQKVIKLDFRASCISMCAFVICIILERHEKWWILRITILLMVAHSSLSAIFFHRLFLMKNKILAIENVINGWQIYPWHCVPGCFVYDIGPSVYPLWSGRNSRNYLRFPARCKLLWYHRGGSMRIRPTIICNLDLTQTRYTTLYSTLNPGKNECYSAYTLRCICLKDIPSIFVLCFSIFRIVGKAHTIGSIKTPKVNKSMCRWPCLITIR